MNFLIFTSILVLKSVICQIQCPDNVPSQSTAACDPDRQNPCNAGFRCRPGTVDSPSNGSSTTAPSQVRFLCCSSANMSILQYFSESGVSPTAVPIVPLTSLLGTVMRDNQTGSLLNVDGIGADLTVNSTNPTLCGTNASLSAGTFTQLDTAIFTFTPPAGEYLHFLVAVDPLLIPSAIFLSYNYPSFGAPIMNLTEMNERFPRGWAQIIGNRSIPAENIYKHDFVVLVFKTERAMENSSMVANDVVESQGDLAHFLSSTKTGQVLDAPILGTLFRLRTVSTIFPTTNSTTAAPVQSSTVFFPNFILFVPIFMFVFDNF